MTNPHEGVIILPLSVLDSALRLNHALGFVLRL